MKLSGWGRYPVSEADVCVPRSYSAVLDRVQSNDGKQLIARGLGRSYGDSALSDRVLSTAALDHFIAFDDKSGILRCNAGVSLAQILQVVVPRGWFLPVTPGTKYVTVGGAIASDVHGKNHHLDGSFSDHVLDILLATVSDGIVHCSHREKPDLFRATAGGMGLTGVILEASIQMREITGAWIEESTFRAANLAELLDLFEQHREAPYSVAWFDALSSGDSLGRSVVTVGRHSAEGERSPAPSPKISIPFDFPGFVLNRYSIRVFNTLYYHRASDGHRRRHFNGFFYPLDGIGDWNRLYGSRGFVQYQFVLPHEAGRGGLGEILRQIADSGRGSFLAVLKAFGEGNDNYLSFPERGITVALDFKLDSGLMSLLDRLDDMVIDLGGRLYLSKDSRMSEHCFKSSYPQWEKFAKVRARYGADTTFHSLQSRRLGL